MAQQTINIGAAANDGTGDTLRDGGDKINDNFTELYAVAAGLGTAAALSTADVDERARDALGSALVAGSGVSITPNDGANTITIAATGSYTSENARDDIGAALTAGAGIAITPNDGADTITIASSILAPAGGGWTPLTFTTSTSLYGRTVYEASESITLTNGHYIEVQGYGYKAAASNFAVGIGDSSSIALLAVIQSDNNLVNYFRKAGADNVAGTAAGVDTGFSVAGIFLAKFYAMPTASGAALSHGVFNDKRTPTTGGNTSTASFDMAGSSRKVFIQTDDISKCALWYRQV